MSTECSGAFGLRGSASDVRGVAAREGNGLMLSGEGEDLVHGGIFGAHGIHRFALGGGGAGFEGTLLAGLTGGFRLPSGDDVSTPVPVLEGNLCAIATPVAICADARLSMADQIAYSGARVSDARSLYAGLSMGFTQER